MKMLNSNREELSEAIIKKVVNSILEPEVITTYKFESGVREKKEEKVIEKLKNVNPNLLIFLIKFLNPNLLRDETLDDSIRDLRKNFWECVDEDIEE